MEEEAAGAGAAEAAGDGEAEAQAVVVAAGQAGLAVEAAAAVVTAEVDHGLARALHPAEALVAQVILGSNTAQEEVGPAVAAEHP